MTQAAHSPSIFPATLHEWERVLTKALLRAEDGNADPIRSFEITPERLAFFCGQSREFAEEAESAFKRALVADRNLSLRLQHGSTLDAGAEVPGCIAILALSLLVDTLIDGDYSGSNEYRGKLRQWLAVDRTFMDLRGIAIMWEALVRWLDARIDKGAPFRRLILPEIPKTWTHIGYTKYLSFPTRRDLRFLERLIGRNPKLAREPASLVHMLDPQISALSVSVGLKNAFADFRVALRSGRASVDHRFWRLVENARSAAGGQTYPLSVLQMEFDEDGRRQYRLRAQTGDILFPRDIGAAASASVLLDSPNLGPGARRGILFFQSAGLANWTAIGEPPSGVIPCHIAVAGRHERQAKGVVLDWEPSGTWLVTRAAVAPGKLNDLLKRLGIHNARENLISVGLVDGVHVGSSWLGAQALLPRVDGARGSVDVRRIGEGATGDLKCADGRLVATGPVEGRYVIGDASGAWSRLATFVACAEVHAELGGAAYKSPLHAEWHSIGSERSTGAPDVEVTWDDRPYEYQSLVEGLYASSKSGIGEGEAIALIDRVLGSRSWDFLRTLVETTFLDERLRLRWRGRMFTLGSARLEPARIGRLDCVIVSGAMPARLEQDFRNTVSLQGGTPFRRLSVGMAPPMLGAIDVDASKLADALGWAASNSNSAPSGRSGEGLVQTDVVGDGYITGSHWDWTRGRFRIDGLATGPVTLTRLVHPGGRDHDLYRVVGDHTRTFTSRHSAILDAHAQASVPMFDQADCRLRRLSLEGALPIEIARSLRRLSVANGGACEDGWIYQVAAQDQSWLTSLLPGLISGINATGTVSASGQTRRGRGARRAMWINGNFAA
ncbi:hypothetical protein [Devosia sp.]|uniref:hypothetical protein n=1 Tax=Devosia sp. TaxID=1871048 RepID=UPI003F72FA45